MTNKTLRNSSGIYNIFAAGINYFAMMSVAGIGHQADLIILSIAISFFIQNIISSPLEEIIPILNEQELEQKKHMLISSFLITFLFSLAAAFVFHYLFSLLIALYTNNHQLKDGLASLSTWIVTSGLIGVLVIFLQKLEILRGNYSRPILYDAIVASALGFSILIHRLITKDINQLASNVIKIRALLIIIIFGQLLIFVFIRYHKEIRSILKSGIPPLNLSLGRSITAKMIRAMPGAALEMITSNFLTSISSGALSIYYYANRVAVLIKVIISGGLLNEYLHKSTLVNNRGVESIHGLRKKVIRAIKLRTFISVALILCAAIIIRIINHAELNKLEQIVILSIAILATQLIIIKENLYSITAISSKRFSDAGISYVLATGVTYITLVSINTNTIYVAPAFGLIFYVISLAYLIWRERKIHG